jgi:putative membrane protein insertion efficiency factor
MDNQKREPVKLDFARMCRDNIKIVHTFLRKRIFKPYLKMVCMRMILFYQRHLSKHTCLYKPTCSQYTLECINNHGALIGILLGTWRILRCNPFSKGGYDPAPERYFKKRWLL